MLKITNLLLPLPRTLYLAIFICLFASKQAYAKTTNRIFMKFGGTVGHGPTRKILIVEWLQLMGLLAEFSVPFTNAARLGFGGGLNSLRAPVIFMTDLF